MESSPTKQSTSKLKTWSLRALSTLSLWLVVVFGVLSHEPIVWFGILGALSLLGLLECLRMFGEKHTSGRRVFCVLVALMYMGLLYWNLLEQKLPLFFADVLLVIVLLLGTFIMQLGRSREANIVYQITGTVFAVLYSVFLFQFLVRIAFFTPEGQPAGLHGVVHVLLLLAVTKGADMGAFIVGSLFGRHKMCPSISPKKTWEGFAGALAVSLLLGVLVFAFFRQQLFYLSLAHVLVIAPILAGFSVIGDLAESLLKRSFAVKDSGSVIPGIGGILDLIDSICFAAPVYFFFLLVMKLLGA